MWDSGWDFWRPVTKVGWNGSEITYDDTKYKKLYRSFSKKYPIYDDLNPNEKIVSNPLGCHDGQRKLLYSEIEFYTELSKSYNLNDIFNNIKTLKE